MVLRSRCRPVWRKFVIVLDLCLFFVIYDVGTLAWCRAVGRVPARPARRRQHFQVHNERLGGICRLGS